MRSPIEYEKGHIPGALNLPLFSNQEREEVGTLYKQSGPLQAFMHGLKSAQKNLPSLISQVRQACLNKKLRLYCARGGLRSKAVGNLFSSLGYQVTIVEGGYKAYRKLRENLAATNLPLRVVGGFTGAGKTEFLLALEKKGYQVLNLEALANHRGSVFGASKVTKQPTDEMFWNLISEKLFSFNLDKTIWVEDESRMIGRCSIPDPLFQQMQKAPMLFLDIAVEKRVGRLLESYNHLEPNDLFFALSTLKKRLGHQRIEKIIQSYLLEEKVEIAKSFLSYYDKSYSHSLKKRPGLIFESFLV